MENAKNNYENITEKEIAEIMASIFDESMFRPTSLNEDAIGKIKRITKNAEKMCALWDAENPVVTIEDYGSLKTDISNTWEIKLLCRGVAGTIAFLNFDEDESVTAFSYFKEMLNDASGIVISNKGENLIEIKFAVYGVWNEEE